MNSSYKLSGVPSAITNCAQRQQQHAAEQGSWLISIDEFRTFSSQEDMINKLALPILDKTGKVVKPTEISIVKLPRGTKVRKSVARPQDWPGQGHQVGGAVQFEIQEQQAKIEWFKKTGDISDFLQ